MFLIYNNTEHLHLLSKILKSFLGYLNTSFRLLPQGVNSKGVFAFGRCYHTFRHSYKNLGI